MSESGQTNPLDRRDFIVRSAKAGAAIVAAGGVALWLHDRKGPSGIVADAAVSLPDFSLSSTGPKLSIVTGADRVKTVNRALAALGGIERFIRSGDRVVLKVNAAFASPPALAATSHPDLVAEVVRLCLRAGAASVVVTDNPINDPQSCFALTGIARAAESAGAKIALPTPSSFKPTTLADAALIKNWPLLFAPFRGATKLIGLAPVKDHHRSGASLTMKNWYGLLGGRRNVFHQDIHTIIFELARLVRPTLVILDGTTTMLTNGPTGGSLDDLKATNTMIASTDAVAADAFGATLLGKTAASLPFIGKAAAAGLGAADFESLNPLRDHVD
ncbi:MAG: DUF362 domain-containing protein [Verrucomicrobiota bacterium]|jgi:uncharacterized protein (DUF362 family)